MNQPDPEREALAKLPVVLGDDEATARYGAGLHEGAEYREHVGELSDQAEDARRELEEAFEAVFQGSEDDLATLDRIHGLGWGKTLPAEEELAAIALAWGAYVGEVVLQGVGGSWVWREDPARASLRFPRVGLQFFPAHAVLRRFALGEPASLAAGYQQLVETLVAR